jgi:N-acetylmuramoyl-L-alanine amidase
MPLAKLLLAALVAGLTSDAPSGAPGSGAEGALPVAQPAPLAADLPVVPLSITAMDSPHQDDRPATATIDAIVIHDTETPGVSEARTIVNWFQHPRSFVSAHYIIGKRGELVQCVPDARRAWHAGPSKLAGRERVNDFSIGIELVNAQTGRDPFTEAQYRTLALLTADLMARWGIPSSRIVGHRHVTNYPSVKRDPADNFDWARYRRDVGRLLGAVAVRREVSPPTQARR